MLGKTGETTLSHCRSDGPAFFMPASGTGWEKVEEKIRTFVLLIPKMRRDCLVISSNFPKKT